MGISFVRISWSKGKFNYLDLCLKKFRVHKLSFIIRYVTSGYFTGKISLPIRSLL